MPPPPTTATWSAARSAHNRQDPAKGQERRTQRPRPADVVQATCTQCAATTAVAYVEDGSMTVPGTPARVMALADLVRLEHRAQRTWQIVHAEAIRTTSDAGRRKASSLRRQVLTLREAIERAPRPRHACGAPLRFSVGAS